MNNLKKRKGILFLLVALIAISSLLISAKVLANGGEWPQFHNDAANTGYTTSEAPDTAYLKWVSDDIGAVSSSSPVLANGKVFINTGDSLTCLNESTGAVLWSENINASSVWGAWQSPAYHNGSVFIATDQIYCFNETGGSPLWTYDMPHDACNGGVTVADGKVIAGDWDGSHYYCVDENTGAQNWVFTVSGYAQGTPAYADGKVYFTSWEYVGDHTYCVNAETGEQIWHQDGLNLDTCGSPCVADGKVFVTTYNFEGYGELIALNATDGSLVWGPMQIERTDSTPAYYDGKLYVCGGCTGYSNEGERTYCFNATNGSLV